jgi:predicted nuclease of restriction endonuclease-like (RecB) superfamily
MSVQENHYNDIFRELVLEIKSTRITVARRVNTTMIQLYWNIGKRLSEEDLQKGYGSSVVKRLSSDLQQEFPETTGFSSRNLWNMKKFYEFYRLADEKLQHSVALLPWSHNLLIMSKIETVEEAQFYVEQVVENGWSRDILLNFIKADTYRHTKILPKQHNFHETLPEHLLLQADEILKSTYNLEFLGLNQPIKERELEKRLVEKIKLFLLELGTSFSFIGNQYRLALGSKDYSVDLLFFNRKFRSLAAIDLKIGSFEPEYIGKMNFYLGLLDDQVKQNDENPSIGIVLCADKNQVEVEVALRDLKKPIGVADYNLQFPEKQIKELIHKEINKTENDNSDELN